MSCSMTITAVFSSARLFMRSLTLILCFMSRYDVGSSKMYRLAFLSTVAAIATLCSSPPLMCLTSWLSTLSRSSAFAIFSSSPFWSAFFRSSLTVPENCCGILSTDCGLYAGTTFPSLTFSKNVCASVPLKYWTSSWKLASFSKSPRFGLSTPAIILIAVDFPIPLTPMTPTTLPNIGVGSE